MVTAHTRNPSQENQTAWRYEIKFQLNDQQLTHVYSWLYNKTHLSECWPTRKVNSLYFDDLVFSSIRNNIIGLGERTKIRARWYNDIVNSHAITIEMKHRQGRLGTKQILCKHQFTANETPISIADAKCVAHDLYQTSSYALTKEDSLRLPVTLIGYNRRYYEDNDHIRVTLDSDIRFLDARQNNTQLEDQKAQYLPYSVLEVKFSPDQKNTAGRLLQGLGLTANRHSKYLAAASRLGLTSYL